MNLLLHAIMLKVMREMNFPKNMRKEEWEGLVIRKRPRREHCGTVK